MIPLLPSEDKENLLLVLQNVFDLLTTSATVSNGRSVVHVIEIVEKSRREVERLTRYGSNEDIKRGINQLENRRLRLTRHFSIIENSQYQRSSSSLIQETLLGQPNLEYNQEYDSSQFLTLEDEPNLEDSQESDSSYFLADVKCVEDGCPICINGVEVGTEMRRLRCSHIFCYACIGRWLNENNSCPICRKIC